MKLSILSILPLTAMLALSSLFTGCAGVESTGQGGPDYYAPDPYQQQIQRQEAISRQQRRLMP